MELPATGISRPNRREWIETLVKLGSQVVKLVSPGLIAGSGLKQSKAIITSRAIQVSPGLIAGSGLKHILGRMMQAWRKVSPGLIAGSGLKPPARCVGTRAIASSNCLNS